MSLSTEQIKALSALAGWEIQQNALFEEAFAHPAGPAGNPKKYSKSYERLEFLGDRILGVVIAEALYHHFKDEPEGKITKRFIALVRKEMLAELSRKIGLGQYLYQLTENEDHLREGDSALADIMESFIAALYLDAGLEVTRNFILKHWAPVMEGHITPPTDAKSMLQEYLQGKGLPLPKYRIIETEGPSNAPLFTVEISGEGFEPAQAQAGSKKVAEHKAAQKVLDKLCHSREGGNPGK